MPHPRMPASFEDVHKSDQIGIDIRMRVRQRIANSCLGSEIDHKIKLVLAEKLLNRRSVSQVAAHHCELRILQ